MDAMERRGRTVGSATFFVLFAVFALGGVAVLLEGVGTAVASFVGPVHDELHVRALRGDWTSRIAQRMADASHDVGGPETIAGDYAFSLLNLALAAFLLWLRPGDIAARLLIVALVGAAGVFNLTAQRTLEELPLTPVEAGAQIAAHITAGLAYVYALLLFPDARPVPRWRPAGVALVYAPVTFLAVAVVLRTEGTQRPAALVLLFGLLTPIAAVVAQAYRFAKPQTPTEREQARLLFWALLPALAVGTIFVVTGRLQLTTGAVLAGRHQPDFPETAFHVFQAVFAIIPLALFVGLLRYRLWDIDRIINRAVVYGAATALLVGIYAGAVVLLQRILSPLTRENDLAVAVSTLAVAAAFRPVLGRIQGFVDRRFYRRRYDAIRTVETFGARLKDEVDLDSLGGELRRVVVGAVEPTHVSMWLRQPNGGLVWAWTRHGSGGSLGAGDGEPVRNEAGTVGR